MLTAFLTIVQAREGHSDKTVILLVLDEFLRHLSGNLNALLVIADIANSHSVLVNDTRSTASIVITNCPGRVVDLFAVLAWLIEIVAGTLVFRGLVGVHPADIELAISRYFAILYLLSLKIVLTDPMNQCQGPYAKCYRQQSLGSSTTCPCQ